MCCGYATAMACVSANIKAQTGHRRIHTASQVLTLLRLPGRCDKTGIIIKTSELDRTCIPELDIQVTDTSFLEHTILADLTKAQAACAAAIVK